MSSVLWDCESESIPFIVVYDVPVALRLLSCDGVDVEN